MPCSQGGYSTVYQRKHDRRGYKLMRVAIHPSRCYAEWWGHTLGFKAAGSLSIHATLASWNAHHAWKVRAKIPRCVKSICKIKTSVLYTHLLTWENCKQNKKQRRELRKREKKCWIWKSNIGFFLSGSIDHRKQTNSLHVGCVTGQLPLSLSLEGFYFAFVTRWYLITVTGEYWKEAGRIESEFGAPAMTVSIQTMIKWTIRAVWCRRNVL